MMIIRRDVSALAAASLFLMAAWPSAQAQDRGTPEEAKAMVAKGLEHVKKVGVEAAFKDFNTDKDTWTKKDIYLFSLSMKGVQSVHAANPRMVGKDRWEVTDAKHKPFFQEFSSVAANGSGWVEYELQHPLTKKIETMTSYIVKIPNSEYYLGAGAYK